jgi:Flp pilus assembly protein TadD
MNHTLSRRQTWLICLGLTLAVLAAYAPLWRAGFITYDDPAYVTANPYVQAGLSWNGMVWALTTEDAGNWHPLTWISHMLDFQLYGMNPTGHHLTSVALHLANSILLFLLLERMTKALWASAMVAALFALHPMHVESVAWVSERKDVLSTLFWILSIWAYTRWVEDSQRGTAKGRRFYVWSLVLFVLGLAAKPMLVTLPFVLLLLDYWPLQRRQTSFTASFVEKIPYFVAVVASCVVTYFVQLKGGALKSLASVPLGMRLQNVPVSYARYLGKTFWPAPLAIPYPIVKWPAWAVAGAIALLLLLSWWACWRSREQPWITVGWLWFLVTLIPVIGIIQVGTQSMADRYHYIPSIGLFIAVVWAARNWGGRLAQQARPIVGVLAAVVCLVMTARQAAFWEDSQKLFLHSIQSTKNNYVAYDRLGRCAETKGQTNAAIEYFETAVRIQPNLPHTLNDLGRVLLGRGQVDEAVTRLQRAVSLDPDFADARYNFGYGLLAEGRVGEALDQFQAQVNLQPADFKAQNNMGTILLQNGLAADAIPYLQKAIAINPIDADPHYLLGNALFRTRKIQDSISQYEQAVHLSPQHIQARNDLAWILACDPNPAVRNGTRAVELASRANQLSGGQNPVVIGTLAAAYAEAGRFSDAIAAEKRACQIAQTQTNKALADVLEKRMGLYQAGSPNRNTN